MAPASTEQLGQSSGVFLRAVNINNTPAKCRHQHALNTTPSEIACLTSGLASSAPIQRSRVGIMLQALNTDGRAGAGGSALRVPLTSPAVLGRKG